jgi:glycine/D-amino acid oxidase-like deaminating enzyme/nitrite reductase/ring-hydroxylating ferredoxin subunit
MPQLTEIQKEPVWGDPIELPRESLRGETTVDVCIIGAGLAGLSVAYNLARAGKQVLVLDDGPAGGGNTGLTTAHLASAIDDRFVEIERIRGKEGARLAADSHAAAITFIEQTARREGIDCDFTRVDGYLFVPPGGRLEILDEEEGAARDAGLTVEKVVRAPLDGFDTGPALRFARQGQFHPLKYLRGLAKAIEEAGGRIVTGIHATSIDGDNKEVRVQTNGKASVVAKAAVVATNSPVNDRITIHTKQFPYLTYALGLEVPRDSITRALYWDTLDPYHYVRLQSGGGNGNGGEMDTLIVGGEDHRTGQAADHFDRWARLEQWARQRFPEVGRATHRWSGQVIETFDGLGFIGRNPGDDRIYIATGDSGMGMTHGTIAGMLISDLILGKENAWAELYEPARKPLKALKAFGEYLAENLNSARQYVDWVTSGQVTSEDDIAPDFGAVVRHGLTKVAAYRDETGKLHTCSAVCPHLKAVVTWNAGEQTWDCPAHGSRFDKFGKVIQGPANSDLEPRECAEEKG